MSLVVAVGACYHIILTAKQPVSQMTAKGCVTQILHMVFQRMQTVELKRVSVSNKWHYYNYYYYSFDGGRVREEGAGVTDIRPPDLTQKASTERELLVHVGVCIRNRIHWCYALALRIVLYFFVLV